MYYLQPPDHQSPDYNRISPPLTGLWRTTKGTADSLRFVIKSISKRCVQFIDITVMVVYLFDLMLYITVKKISHVRFGFIAGVILAQNNTRENILFSQN